MLISIKNKIKISGIVLLWSVFVLIHTLTLSVVSDIPFQILFVEGLLHAVLFSILLIVCWNILSYAVWQNFPLLQRILNYILIAFLGIAISISLGFLLIYFLYGNRFTDDFLALIPLRTYIDILLFVIIILVFQKSQVSCVDDGINEIKIETSEESVKLLEEQTDKVEPLERLAVKTGTKINVIMVSDVLYFHADGDYVQIVTEKGKNLKELTMKYLENNLPQGQFVRIHRSYIVQVEKISRIELYEKQSQRVILKNGQLLPVSVSGYKLLRAALHL